MIILLAIAFLLELVAFFSFAALAFIVPIPPTLQIVLYVLLLIIVVVFWGVFMSPRSLVKLKAWQYYSLKSLIYLTAGGVLLVQNYMALAIIFIIVWLIDDISLFLLHKSPR